MSKKSLYAPGALATNLLAAQNSALWLPKLSAIGTSLRRTVPANMKLRLEATWRSGYAAACKAVNAGSIPAVASIPLQN